VVVEIKEYESPTEIAKSMDSQISKTKSILGEYLRKLDEIRTLAERSKKIREVVFKLAGKKQDQSSLGEITVGDLRVILDANPFHELTVIEKVVRSQQDRLLVLQRAREALNWVEQLEDTNGLKYLVLETDGVPEKILLKIS
jgi:hypothetical protein